MNIEKEENQPLLEDKRIQRLLNEGAKSIADLFIENDRPIYTEKVFENIADYVKNSELLKLRKEN
jgi:hypothetical protein